MGQNGVAKSLRDLSSFFIPKQTKVNDLLYSCYNTNVAVVIPTYNPQQTTVQIIGSWLCYVPRIQVIIVDDSTPEEKKDPAVYRQLQHLSDTFERVHFIRSPRNLFRAGAINVGIEYIQAGNLKIEPDVVVACDDDTYITSETMGLLLRDLYQHEKVGAVCSQARIMNKNKNLVTRLQGLEYHGFNITRESDNGLYHGPLVMHGLLSVYRYEAITGVGGFTAHHLIEDYDLTVRLKKNGWQVRYATDAAAWTDVPETVSTLWKQRIRWYCGGLRVLSENYKSTGAVVQDLLGHFVFLSMTLLVILSFMLDRSTTNLGLVSILFFIGIIQFAISFTFNMVTLKGYQDADAWDWVLRLVIIPEFLYSNLMSLILIGSYLYYSFNSVFGRLSERIIGAQAVYKAGLKIFSFFGYTLTWGTK